MDNNFIIDIILLFVVNRKKLVMMSLMMWGERQGVMRTMGGKERHWPTG